MTGRRFTSFILLAEMRTGSNLLEESLNLFADIRCHGELFNPHFIGGPNRGDAYETSLKQREKDPFRLLAEIRRDAGDALPGFRFFHDHDPRILEACLDDRRCAKVILNRNPLERYVSLKIAARTGQWKLTNVKHQRSARVRFEAAEFTDMIARSQEFQVAVLRRLQVGGQGAFYINYEDLNRVEVINGLARYLGSAHRIEALSRSLKKQNPGGLESKISNYAQMQKALAEIDFMNLARTPDFEPRRGAGVPGWIGGEKVPLLLQTVAGGPGESLRDWLAAHEGRGGGPILGFTRKTLRDWRAARPGHVSLSAVRHPLARAHHVFCSMILPQQDGPCRGVRNFLQKTMGLKLPGPDAGPEAHRRAFVGFLKFLKANLSNQTSLRIDPAWASQTALLQGMATVALPGLVVREAQLPEALAHVEALLGLPARPYRPEQASAPVSLAEIHDQELESRCRAAYGRDYLDFGFGDWQPLAP